MTVSCSQDQTDRIASYFNELTWTRAALRSRCPSMQHRAWWAEHVVCDLHLMGVWSHGSNVYQMQSVGSDLKVKQKLTHRRTRWPSKPQRPERRFKSSVCFCGLRVCMCVNFVINLLQLNKRTFEFFLQLRRPTLQLDTVKPLKAKKKTWITAATGVLILKNKTKKRARLLITVARAQPSDFRFTTVWILLWQILLSALI